MLMLKNVMVFNSYPAVFTPEDYLELEQGSLIKHEYLQGQMVAMAGASKAHVIITGNLAALLLNHLRGQSCLVYANEMKVRLSELNIFYYPDIAVTCDDRDRQSQESFIRYPTVIIEVLSDATESFDRGKKFADYKSILEFKDYVLIHQKQRLIEHFQRCSENLWLPTIYQYSDEWYLASLNFRCRVASLYDGLDQLL
jgi:Uma2 family endonuclease